MRNASRPRQLRRLLAGARWAPRSKSRRLEIGRTRTRHRLTSARFASWCQVRTAVRMLARRPLTDPSIDALLCVALYQLIHTIAPAHAGVDSAVRATVTEGTSAKGLTNAILRTFLRAAKPSRRDLERCGRALFVSAVLIVEYSRGMRPRSGDSRCSNVRPPLTLRVNGREKSREEYSTR